MGFSYNFEFHMEKYELGIKITKGIFFLALK